MGVSGVQWEAEQVRQWVQTEDGGRDFLLQGLRLLKESGLREVTEFCSVKTSWASVCRKP